MLTGFFILSVCMIGLDDVVYLDEPDFIIRRCAISGEWAYNSQVKRQ